VLKQLGARKHPHLSAPAHAAKYIFIELTCLACKAGPFKQTISHLRLTFCRAFSHFIPLLLQSIMLPLVVKQQWSYSACTAGLCLRKLRHDRCQSTSFLEPLMETQKITKTTSPSTTAPARRFSRSIMAACLSLAALAAVSTSAQADTSDAVDNYVRAEMQKRRIPGMSVAVLRDNKVIKENTYGLANVELNVPVKADTSYALASMTKVFTATAIMLLVQDGQLKLDEPIIKILPQLPATWSAITVRHCLSHTSGLPDALTDDINITTISGDREQLLEELTKMPLQPAGEKSVYNQTGYMLLGMVIEKISGMPYEQFMQTRVFTPAGLANARFGDAWSIIPGRSDLYTSLDITKDHTKLLVKDGRPVILTDKILHYGAKFMPDYLAPAGLLNGNIHDLVNFEVALAEGKLLKSASLKEMSTPYKLRDGSNGDFGLGFVFMPFGKQQAISYGGGAAAWRVSLPEKHLTVVVLTNLQGAQPHALAGGIAALYDTAP
jgi:CubicO group peptidase (beta-lactamase class C family)